MSHIKLKFISEVCLLFLLRTRQENPIIVTHCPSTADGTTLANVLFAVHNLPFSIPESCFQNKWQLCKAQLYNWSQAPCLPKYAQSYFLHKDCNVVLLNVQREGVLVNSVHGQTYSGQVCLAMRWKTIWLLSYFCKVSLFLESWLSQADLPFSLNS